MPESGSGEDLTDNTMEKHGTQTIEDLVVQWGSDRKIIQNSTAFAQSRKTLEEVVELLQAVMHEDLLDIEDAIGDIWVTMVMACHCRGVSLGPVPVLAPESDALSYGKTRLVELIAEQIPDLFLTAYDDSAYAMRDVCKQIELLLQVVCWKCNLNYEEAKYAAYQQIKDRKGYLREDGVFVKES